MTFEELRQIFELKRYSKGFRLDSVASLQVYSGGNFCNIDIYEKTIAQLRYINDKVEIHCPALGYCNLVIHKVCDISDKITELQGIVPNKVLILLLEYNPHRRWWHIFINN